MTLTQLAKLAHVSLPTASKAFSMSEEIPAETRDMIFDLAKEHGCFRKFFKVKYPRLVIGIVCYEIQSKYYSTLIELVKNEFEKNGCEICLRFTDYDREQNFNSIQYFEKYTDVDALMFWGDKPKAMAKPEIPFACFSKEPTENIDLSINISDNNAAKNIFDKAKSKGISKIGFIGESQTIRKKDRFEMYYKDVFGNNNDFYYVTVEDRFEKGGYVGMKELFENHKPEIVLCAYDNMAFGAIRYAHDVGLKIPEDVQIIGMNNIEETKYSVPRLSTIGIDNRKFAERIVNTFYEIILGKGHENFISIDEEFIENESSKLN